MFLLGCAEAASGGNAHGWAAAACGGETAAHGRAAAVRGGAAAASHGGAAAASRMDWVRLLLCVLLLTFSWWFQNQPSGTGARGGEGCTGGGKELRSCFLQRDFLPTGFLPLPLLSPFSLRSFSFPSTSYYTGVKPFQALLVKVKVIRKFIFKP